MWPDVIGTDEKQSGTSIPQTYVFWEATEEEWIGPLWPRGRAFEKGLSKAEPKDKICSMWSGPRVF
tara:strand:- start:3245 stop:3442 length:198 start_codon:yes stop_codon:yes gene_type:complete